MSEKCPQETEEFLIFFLENKVGVNWESTVKRHPDLIDKMWNWYKNSKKERDKK